MGFNKQDGQGPPWRRGYDGEVVRKIVVEKDVDLKELLDELKKKQPEILVQPIPALHFEILQVDKTVFDVINEIVFIKWNGVQVDVDLSDVVENYNQRKQNPDFHITLSMLLKVWPQIKNKYCDVGWGINQSSKWDHGDKVVYSFNPPAKIKE